MPLVPLLQVLAICKEYQVRLTGELYAQLLKSQLLFSTIRHSSKPSKELDDVLHSLECLKDEGEKWPLLLDAGDRSALCAVLNQYGQHALLLQTVKPWLSLKVCMRLACSVLHYAFCLSPNSSLCIVHVLQSMMTTVVGTILYFERI